MTQLECVLGLVEEAISVLQGMVSVTSDVTILSEYRARARECLRILLASTSTSSRVTAAVNSVYVCQTGSRGRPRIVVNVEEVELLRSAGYTWEEIAEIMAISRATLWRRLNELNIPLSKYSDITDRDLDVMVEGIQQANPTVGLVMLQGYLSSQGVTIQRRRLRESVMRINPVRMTRWQHVLSRRSYHVPGPNSLWHIDTHHSLIRWRCIVQGGIDGYSRMVVYLSCSKQQS